MQNIPEAEAAFSLPGRIWIYTDEILLRALISGCVWFAFDAQNKPILRCTMRKEAGTQFEAMHFGRNLFACGHAGKWNNKNLQIGDNRLTISSRNSSTISRSSSGQVP
jgi:hypothetical protein